MTVKEWLNRARRLDYEINALIRAKEDTWARIVSTTSAPSGVVVSQTKNPHKFDRYIELQDRINERIDYLCAVKAEILSAINRVDDTVLRTLLIERYINCKTWEQVAVDMHWSFCAIVQHKHPAALNAIKPYIELYDSNVL